MAHEHKMFDMDPEVEKVKGNPWRFLTMKMVVAVALVMFLLLLCIIFIALYAAVSSSTVVASEVEGIVTLAFQATSSQAIIWTDGQLGLIPPAPYRQTKEILVQSIGVMPLEEKTTCDSKECLKLAVDSIDLMNQSVDPCDNFYQYACGNYKATHPIIGKEPRSIIRDIEAMNSDRLAGLLQSLPNRLNKRAYERKLEEFFRLCNDDSNREKLLGRPFLEQVLPAMGGWDLIGTWNETAWDLNTMLMKAYADFNVDILYVVRVDSSRSIQLRRPMYKYFPRISRSRLKEYKEYMRGVASLFVRDASLVNVTTEDKEWRLDRFVNDTCTLYLKIETAMRRSRVPWMESSNNEITVDELNQQTRSVIDWKEQLSYLFKLTNLSGDTRLVVTYQKYFQELSDVIESIPVVDRKRILHNFFIWLFIEKYGPYLSWEYVLATQHFYGMADFKGLENMCMELVKTYMKDALGALYIQAHLDEQNWKEVQDIATHLKKALQVELDQCPWMDKATKEYAKFKVNETSFKLGYPSWMANEDMVDEVYTDLMVNSSEFFRSVISANQFFHNKIVRSFDPNDDIYFWLTGIYKSRIQYVHPFNQLYLTAGLLQQPLYYQDAPYYKTFGSLGVLLGTDLHKIVDTYGKKYDKDGRFLRSSDGWWTAKSVEAYKPVEKCVGDLYTKELKTIEYYKNSFLLDSPGFYAHVAIATTSGIRMAFKGYRDWVKAVGSDQEKMIPGLGLSAEQTFFLSYAHARCENSFDKRGKRLFVDTDLLKDVEVNMALGQLQEFSDAFQCKPGTKMNHKKKCSYY